MAYIRTMYREQAPIQPNGDDWGFASATLSETTPQTAIDLVGTTARRENA
jgi:hypothetical protein